MKRIIFAFVVSVMLVSCATAPAVGPTAPERIIEVQKSKAEIFVASMDWIAKTFMSAKSVIEYQDKEAGKIVGHGSALVNYALIPMDTHFTLTIDAKDGKARISIQGIYFETSVSGAVNRSNADASMSARFMQLKGNAIFDSYAAAITSKPSEW